MPRLKKIKEVNGLYYITGLKLPNNIIEGAIIAEMELREKKLPFIIRRPLPNGSSEYWKIEDLEVLSF